MTSTRCSARRRCGSSTRWASRAGATFSSPLIRTSSDYAVIEVNPRVSRSSALASKATGYPIARMAAKIAIGRRLDELANPVTRRTTAAFEPALDYVVVKILRWPFDKFSRADRTIGTQMKATGEVMAIDRSFEGALQKAVRSLETGATDLVWEDPGGPMRAFSSWSRGPTTFDCGQSWRHCGEEVGIDELHELSRIDRWFLYKPGKDRRDRAASRKRGLDPDLLWTAKRAGFSDQTIARLSRHAEPEVRCVREA